MKTYIKVFFIFMWTFLFVVTCIALPSLIREHNYKNIIILIAIIGVLVAFSITLYNYFAKVYEFEKFIILRETIELSGKSNTSLSKKDVKEIIVTPYRYTFVLNNGQKKSVTRIKKPFKVESCVSSSILYFSEEYNVPIMYGMF